MKKKLPPLRLRLEEERKKLNVSWNALEQDYVLSWVLMGISSIPELNQNLAFKGGTALKKYYFGEYRFSEDLDFSYIGQETNNALLEEYLQQACNVAIEHMAEYMPAPKLTIEKYTEKQPHPEGQLAFVIRAQLPWHREPSVKVMVEITMKEDVKLPLLTKQLIHNYGENIIAAINVYSLEEIVVEKLRAILQYTKKLHDQGWARSRVRDYYDLWHIFKNFGSEIDYQVIARILESKCRNKGVSFATKEDFFQPKAITEARKGWMEWLQPLLTSLPNFDELISNLEEEVAKIILIKNLTDQIIKRTRQSLSSADRDIFYFKYDDTELYRQIDNPFGNDPVLRFYDKKSNEQVTDVDKIIIYLERNK